MDIKLIDAVATDEERAAVDAVLGPPENAWEGAEHSSGSGGHWSERVLVGSMLHGTARCRPAVPGLRLRLRCGRYNA
jgi:hypothetical protein